MRYEPEPIWGINPPTHPEKPGYFWAACYNEREDLAPPFTLQDQEAAIARVKAAAGWVDPPPPAEEPPAEGPYPD